jgi:aspartate/methionine/tyrosine aminotransferase
MTVPTMRSRRLPASLDPNAWARAVASARAAGHALLDLTESNPTRVGLSEWTPELQAMLADARAQRYEPDPRGDLAAREAIARYHGERGAAPSPGSVVLTSGTSESYAHLFRLLADPDDVVLVPRPSYPLFEPIADLEAVRLESYRLAWDGAWHLDLGSVDAALAAAGERARALILVEPNHPTGTTLDESEREALVQRLATRGIALISDEVFADFPWPPRHDPLPGWLGERRVPTFVLGGLSKCCGLPQLKLGWIAVSGPDRERREMLEGLEWIGDLFLSVATPTQMALPELLGSRHAYQDRVRRRLQSNLDALTEWRRGRSEIDALAGAAGWSVVLRLPAARDAAWERALLERDVVVHPGHFYGVETGDTLVLSLIPETPIFREGLGRIGAALDER